MPAMCGAAIDVPLIVMNVPTSVGSGPLRGSPPDEQTQDAEEGELIEGAGIVVVE